MRSFNKLIVAATILGSAGCTGSNMINGRINGQYVSDNLKATYSIPSIENLENLSEYIGSDLINAQGVDVKNSGGELFSLDGQAIANGIENTFNIPEINDVAGKLDGKEQ